MNDNENNQNDAEVAAQDKEITDALAFDAMTPRLHRKQAQELLFCVEHGAMGPLLGQSKGTDTAAKIASLNEARERLAEADKHLKAAIADYEAASAQA